MFAAAETQRIASSHYTVRLSRELTRMVTNEKRLRILIVEDDEWWQKAFAAIFKQPALAACSVEFANSANQAMAMLMSKCFDLAILDYHLGDHNAAQLVDQWRKFGYELPFVCVSDASADSYENSAMRSLGSCGHIAKSEADNPAALERFINAAISGYWMEQASLCPCLKFSAQ